MPNYAYQVLLLEIIVEDDLYPRKPTIDEISRLIQLYMVYSTPLSLQSKSWSLNPIVVTVTSKGKSTP